MSAPEIFQIGSKHAVRDYLRRIRASCGKPIDDPDDWFAQMLAGYRRKLTPAVREAALATLADGPTSANILRMNRTTAKRLGKEIFSIVTMRAYPAIMTPLGGGAAEGREDEILMLWRETCDIGAERLDVVSGPSHLALTRHALERIHQREGCMTGEIDDKIKEQIVDADRNVAFAAAAGLCLGSPDGAIHPGNTLLIPLADALLVVEARCIPLKQMTARVVVKKRAVQPRTVETNANNAVVIRDRAGSRIMGTLMHTARTYLSSEILRPEQREYRDLFLGFASDEAMAGLDAEFHQAQRADRKTKVKLSFTDDDAVRMARLRQLLPRCVSTDTSFHQLWDVT